MKPKQCSKTLGVLVIGGLLASCSAASPDRSEENTAETNTVTHALGSTEVPADPQRVVALGLVDEDALAALDITPVGYLGYGREGLFPWQEGEADLSDSTDLDDVGGAEEAELNFEKLASLKPDLILATGYWQIGDQYDKLSEIAPTVGPISEVGANSWQDTTRLIGAALGRAEDTEVEIQEIEQKVADMADDLPGLQGKTFVNAFVWADGSIIVGANAEESLAQILGGLGMSLSEKVVTEINPNGTLTGGQPIAMERLDLLDADLLLLGAGSEELRAGLESNKLFASLPVVQEDRVTNVDRTTSASTNNPTILNVPWFLEQIRPGLERVATAS